MVKLVVNKQHYNYIREKSTAILRDLITRQKIIKFNNSAKY